MTKREMALFRKFIVSMSIVCCVLMLAYTITATATTAYAQPAGQPPPRDKAGAANGAPPPASEDMAKALKLTPKQTAEVEAILAAERKEMQALRDAMRAKADALHDATKKKLSKLLNAEQMGRYAEWREAHRPPRPDGGPPPRRP